MTRIGRPPRGVKRKESGIRGWRCCAEAGKALARQPRNNASAMILALVRQKNDAGGQRSTVFTCASGEDKSYLTLALSPSSTIGSRLPAFGRFDPCGDATISSVP